MMLAGPAALVAGLAGCATPVPSGEVLALTAAGRLSLRIDPHAGRPAQSLSAGFEWRGDGERGELTLLSPLGTQLAKARWAPGVAWLTSSEGEARFDNLDDLAERALGERVPLAAWPDWLAGRPWPHAPATLAASAAPAAPATSATAGFEQLGWSVNLARHAEGRIEARRSAPPVVTVRIVLDAPAPPTSQVMPTREAGAP
jgi:outer membrane lipoprotein LolB